MVTAAGQVRQDAPGDLEEVRELLNTWLIPNDTRRPTDRFAAYAAERRLKTAEAKVVRQLRDDLRTTLTRRPDHDDVIDNWIDTLDFRPRIDGAGGLGFRHRPGLAGRLLAAVLDAAAQGRWHRLKTCPDCQWVFYDHSRNASKRWCLMNAGGPNGRACGTIAKVRRYRERQSTQ